MNQIIERFISKEEQELLVTKTLSLAGSDPEAKRAEIKDYFHRTFTLYERLFDCLASDEAYYTKAIPLRHPLIFYYGHTAVFLINKLRVAKLISDRLDPELEAMVAIGVDEMSWDDLDEANYNWPSPQAVKAYRDKVRQLVDAFIDTAPLTLPIKWEDPMWIVLMGIEHERIHLETSSVLIRQLPFHMVKPSRLFTLNADQHTQAPVNELLPVEGKTLVVGKDRDNAYYGWDNEYGKQKTDVAPFKASKYLVSNSEYLEFVEAGGYSNKACWTDEGWAWVEYTGVTMPEFWIGDLTKGSDSLRYRSMTHEIDMPWSWPVDVNYLEAKAFCNWKSEQTGRSIRLPSEAEWYAMRSGLKSDQPDWDEAPGNINLEHGASACPVDQFSTRLGNATELFDLIGNVWQWTETPIDALPGFEVHPAYDDFSTPTFDGKHNLIKGGCFFSTGNYAIKDSRYAFRRHFFQHAGFRYIEAEGELVIEANPYETDELVSQYLEFHYGEEHFGVENFARRCGEICNEAADREGLTGDSSKVLDIGCAVGRTSFELGRAFGSVDALDFSARFINAAVELQQNGIKRYTMKTEGSLVDFKEIRLDALGYIESAPRCHFMQGDACNLSDKYSGYNLIFAGNLIDRLYSPRQFLSTIHEHLNPGGLLVLTSPYTWLEEYTEPDQWLGGFKDNVGENFTTLDGLKETLGGHFELVEEPRDVPFVIRETARKFQHTLSQMTIWRRIH